MSGNEMVRVEKTAVHHQLYTCLSSCFGSACRVCDYDQCYTHSKYPALVPKLKLDGVEETVVMDTGVDPKAGVDPPANPRKRKAPQKVFGKRQNVCLMKRVTGTQFGLSFCDST